MIQTMWGCEPPTQPLIHLNLSSTPGTPEAETGTPEAETGVITQPFGTTDYPHQRRSCRKTFAASGSQDYSLGD